MRQRWTCPAKMALMMSLNKRESMRVPAILCLLAVVANFIVFGQIVAKMARKTHRADLEPYGFPRIGTGSNAP